MSHATVLLRARALFVAAAALGAATVAAQTPDAVWSGTHADDALGHAVAEVGDIDGDGVVDLAIASPWADRQLTLPLPFLIPDTGRVVVRSGETGAVLHDWYGPSSGWQFGYAVAGAGDVDGDGHDDVLVGMPLAHGPLGAQGAVQVRSGATGLVLRTHHGTQRAERFGHALAGRGAFDGHTARDYAIGAPYHDVDDDLGGFEQEGAVYVYAGASGQQIAGSVGGDGPLNPYSGSDTDVDVRHLGWSLAILDAHLAMGAPRTDTLFTQLGLYEDTGLVRIVEVATGVVHQTIGGVHSEGGTSVALGQAVPGGEPEVAFGAPGGPNGGRAAVMTPGFEPPEYAWQTHVWISGTPTEAIGDVVAFVGDVDGGGDDLAIGAPLADVGSPFVLADAGIVRVRRGSDGAPLDEYRGKATGDRFGASVVGVERTTGGFVDLLVGAPGDDTAIEDVGGGWWFDNVPCHAAATTYGVGLPGAGGVPTLDAAAHPVIGQTTSLELGNAAGQSALASLVFGFDTAAAPFKGGTLLVTPWQWLALALPAGGASIPAAIPDDASLCDVHLFVQLVHVDAAAVAGLALSPGLELHLGW